MTRSRLYINLKKERGAALLSALIIITIVTITGIAIGQLTSNTQKDTVADYDSTYSFYNTDDVLTTSEFILNMQRADSTAKASLTDGESADALVVSQRKGSKWWLDNAKWTEGKPQKIINTSGEPAKGVPIYHIEDLNDGGIIGMDKHGTISDSPQTLIMYYRITARSFGYISSTEQNENSETIMQTIYLQLE